MRYLRIMGEKEKDRSPDESTISVSEVSSALAFYYEKIRNIIDYQDEHLLRQSAIKRILNRRLIFQESREDIADALLKELIRSRYFSNNTISSSEIVRVGQILDIYIGVAETLRQQHQLSDRDEEWLLGMASCAIDELLAPLAKEEALVHLMYETLAADIEIAGGDEKLHKQQVYIAAYRALLRPDVTRLRFFILKHTYAEWTRLGDADTLALAEQYSKTHDTIESLMKHPLNRKLSQSFRRYRISFFVLHTLVKKHGPSILEQSALLETEVAKLCESLYQMQKKRLFSRTVRAFVYIFLTKMILGFAIELPYDILTLGHVNSLPLIVNVIFPPALLLAITLSAKFPDKKNTEMITQALKEIAGLSEQRTVFVTQRVQEKKRSPVLTVVFTLLHLALFAVSFGAIIRILQYLQFNVVSGIIFILFICLITFFGVSLRRSVRDFIILKSRPSLTALFFDSFFLPIIQVGRWLSFNISRINIFIFLFDVLIELPFQALVEITEEWFSFLKEKKEDID